VQKAKEQMNIFKQVQGGTPYAHNHNMTLIQMFFFVFSIKLVAYFQVPTSNNFFLVPKFLLKFEIGFGASTHTKAFFFSFFFQFFKKNKNFLLAKKARVFRLGLPDLKGLLLEVVK
jgi:hypothetical protein